MWHVRALIGRRMSSCHTALVFFGGAHHLGTERALLVAPSAVVLGARTLWKHVAHALKFFFAERRGTQSNDVLFSFATPDNLRVGVQPA